MKKCLNNIKDFILNLIKGQSPGLIATAFVIYGLAIVVLFFTKIGVL